MTKEDYEREKLQGSISRLQGGIVIIKVGGLTELEMFERKYRIEDAVNATVAAVDEGVVVGGGCALLRTADEVDRVIASLEGDEKTGAQIVRAALEAPIRQIAENAGVDGSVVVEKLLENKDANFGYDALKGQFVDMMEVGIIDPVKVVKIALESAVSVSTLFLTMNAGVADPQIESGDTKH